MRSIPHWHKESVLITSSRMVVVSALVACAGVVVSFAVVPLIARTAAIVDSVGFLTWFAAIASPELASLLWSFAVVGLLGAGIAVFLACLVVLRVAGTSRVLTLVVFIAGFFIGLNVLVFYDHDQTDLISSVLLNRPWWGYGVELSVVFSVAAAALVHSWLASRRGVR